MPVGFEYGPISAMGGSRDWNGDVRLAKLACRRRARALGGQLGAVCQRQHCLDDVAIAALDQWRGNDRRFLSGGNHQQRQPMAILFSRSGSGSLKAKSVK